MRIKEIALGLIAVTGFAIFPKINVQAAVNNRWNLNDSTWYYYINGTMQTGWVLDNGCWYYLKNDGSMATGWQKIDNTWYYLNTDGSMKTGWLKDGDTWYYLNNDGSMKTGWFKQGNVSYFLNNDGSMKIGWLKKDDKWYYFNDNGSMKEEDWLFDKNGKIYYFRSDGAMVVRSFQHDLIWYYQEADNACRLGSKVYNSRYYDLMENGEWREDIPVKNDDVENTYGITMRTSQNEYIYDPNVVIHYTFYNNTNDTTGFGEKYSIEKYIDGKWEAVPLVYGEFNEPYYTIESYTKFSDRFSIQNIAEEKPNGRYRIVKNIGGKNVYAEFNIINK